MKPDVGAVVRFAESFDGTSLEAVLWFYMIECRFAYTETKATKSILRPMISTRSKSKNFEIQIRRKKLCEHSGSCLWKKTAAKEADKIGFKTVLKLFIRCKCSVKLSALKVNIENARNLRS